MQRNRAWSEQEIARLRADWTSLPVSEIAAKLGRDEKSVRNKAGALGLRRGRTKSAWSSREIELLQRLYGAASVRELAARLGRPVKAVYQKAHELGVTRRDGA